MIELILYLLLGSMMFGAGIVLSLPGSIRWALILGGAAMFCSLIPQLDNQVNNAAWMY